MSKYERGSSTQRGYDRRWRKARALFLNEHPLCSMCPKPTPATVVDHITPHKGDKALFWDRSNWQPLCKHCHDSHKQRLEKTGRIIGCNAEGFPIDPNHHWGRGD